MPKDNNANDADDADLEKLISETTTSPPESTDTHIKIHATGCLSLTRTYLSIICNYHQSAIWIGISLSVVIVALCFIFTGRSTEELPSIKNDYSNIKSEYDLSLGKIDHWCLYGDDESCTCQDPLHPNDLSEKAGWMKAHKQNKGLIQKALDDEKEIDIVFLGDAITEEWTGRLLGRNGNGNGNGSDDLKKIARVFKRTFTKDGGGDFEGIPLGIAGDTASNLLWRILNGEMPDDLNPKIWWILIGIGDLAKRECSEEVVLLGILRVVEEIRKKKPNSFIVINGILPTSTVRGGLQSNSGSKRFRRWSAKNLWPSIHVINTSLKQFCMKQKKVRYFDPMEVFAEKKGKNYAAKKNLMRDPIHPSFDGHREWAKAIVQKIRMILRFKKKGNLVDVDLDGKSP